MDNHTRLATLRFLIIAGTSKAGTTSVFNYLAKHPQICPANKETRFFLDVDYPLPSKKRYGENGPEAYLSLFSSTAPEKEENWRFEATPDYLYSPNTAVLIHRTLPNVRLIFILREPISRLLSWYRFGRKRNQLPSNMTFDDYVEMQRRNGLSFPTGHGHPAFYALQHGCYSVYLKRYLDLFERSSIDIRFFEDLAHDPGAFMQSICGSLGLDPTYFRDYRFHIVNKGIDVRNWRFHRTYVECKQSVRRVLRHMPNVRSLLSGARSALESTYARLNVLERGAVTISPSTRKFLLHYYEDEPARLRDLAGIEVPWLAHMSADSSELEASFLNRESKK